MRGKIWIIVLAASLMAQSNRPQVPTFEPDPLWSQALPNKWVNGQVGGVAVDPHDNVWVFHRPATIPDGEKVRSVTSGTLDCQPHSSQLMMPCDAHTPVCRSILMWFPENPPGFS